jgi:diguanylate cyclase (GGDEF)-like protein
LTKDTILIVDDMDTNLKILKELLNKTYNIVSSISSTRVLDIALEHKPDLILLDIMMPEYNGYEVCKKLKNNPKTKDIPVIFITVRTDEDSIEKAYNAGGIDFISKPFKPKELLMRISTQLKLKKLIEDLESSKAQLKDLASIDSLTKLYNRRYCMKISQHLITEMKQDNTNISVMMLDIDEFKSINDTYGHLGGDKVLIDIANKIQNFMQDLGVVCRYGGEEFVILLPKLDINEAYLLAKKLNENIANTKIYFENKEINLTISIGVADVKVHEEDTIEKALHRADKALYRVKNSGKNSVDIEV